MKNKPRLLLAIVATILFFCFVNKNNVYADKQYLDLSYNKVRYEQENGKGTTIWYAIIPAKYKMHYAYGNDRVWSGEKPSENAVRHNATIAVNSQILGFPIIDGVTHYEHDSVAGYDFSIEQNPNSVTDYDLFNVYANSPTDPRNGMSFYGVNIGFSYDGNGVDYIDINGDNRTIYMALFSQIVQDGTVLDFNNINSRASEYGTARHPRTWLTYDSQGNQFVAVSAGRDADGPQAGLTFRELYDATRTYFTTDIYTLYNLDGGGSSGFIYKGTKISPNYDVDKNTGLIVERKINGIFYWKVETQVVSFEEASITKTYGDANFISAATTTGDGTISYSSSDSTIAEVNSQTGEVTIKKAGEVTITATAAATDVYNSASSSYTLTINKRTATVSFKNNTITKTFGDANFTNAATTTGDGAITYSSSDTDIAEVNSETGEVTIKAAGEVTITAYAAATTNCTAASTSYTLTINKADRTISFAENSITKTFGDANFTNIATTTGDGVITYTSSNANIASVNKNTGVVTIKKAGQVTITATVAATNNYDSASSSYTLTINKADRTISFAENSITKTYGDANFTNIATTTGDGIITYESSNDSIASVNNAGLVTIKKAGEVTITATVSETENYTSASSGYALTINKHTATVSFASSTVTKTYGDANFINAATTTSDGTITHSSSDPSVAEVNSETGEVTIRKTGEVTITASVAATNNYTSASASYTLTVDEHTTTISFENTHVTKTYGDANFTNAATTTSDGTITYSSSDNNIAEVNSETGEVTIKKAGEITITATTTTGNYESASASYTLTINKKTSQAPAEISELKNGYVTDRLSSISFSTIGLAWVNPKENIEEGSHFYLVNYTEHNDASNYTTEQFEVAVLGKRMEYIVIEGDKQTFIIEEDGTIAFKINADYELFGDDGEIYIDNVLVERKNYDAESGSTIIKLHYDFVKTLALGEHTFTAIFNDGGIATASFALATEDPVLVPNTGNNTAIRLELKPAHAVVTMVIATLFYLYRKKIQRQKEHVKFD